MFPARNLQERHPGKWRRTKKTVATTAVLAGALIAPVVMAGPASAADGNLPPGDTAWHTMPEYFNSGSFSPDPSGDAPAAYVTPGTTAENKTKIATMGWNTIEPNAWTQGTLKTQQYQCNPADGWYNGGYKNFHYTQCMAPHQSQVKVMNNFDPFGERGRLKSTLPLSASYKDAEHFFVMYRAGDQRAYTHENCGSFGCVTSLKTMPVYKIVQISDEGTTFNMSETKSDVRPNGFGCFEARGGGTSGGALIEFNQCDRLGGNQASQNWMLVPDGEKVDGFYLVNQAAIQANPNTPVQEQLRMSLPNVEPGVYRPIDASTPSLQPLSANYTQSFSFPYEGSYMTYTTSNTTVQQDG